MESLVEDGAEALLDDDRISDASTTAPREPSAARGRRPEVTDGERANEGDMGRVVESGAQAFLDDDPISDASTTAPREPLVQFSAAALGAGLGAGPDAARKAPGSTGVAEAVDSDRRGEALNDDCDRRGTGQNYIDYRAYFP